MANTYTQLLYLLVFSTKERRPALRQERREDVFRYIWGIIKARSGHLYRIGGVEDHVHILTSVPPTVALADFVRDVKAGSSKWIRDESVYPLFPGWQDGYGAFTIGFAERDGVIEYIRNQSEHHREISYVDELRAMLKRDGVAFDEQYLV